MSHGKWAFIINPAAGNGKASGFSDIINKMAARFGVKHQLIKTKKKKHASDIASDLSAKGTDYIIAVGGDGTVSEVAAGVIGTGSTLGVVPAGSGNDFIPMLGYPESFSETEWKSLFRARTIEMDVGECNGNYFINGMGFGIDAQIAADTQATAKERGGTGSYFRHIIKNLFLYREKPIRLLTKGKEQLTSCFIKTIGIGRRFGGGYRITDGAIANDGLFDICTVDRLNLLQRLRLFPKVSKGKHIGDRKVDYFRTSSIEIETEETVPYHLDGEVYFDRKFSVKILKRKLKVIFEPMGKHFFDIPSS
ncbi:MAG: diacylglycerol kinase family lipid kinase [Nitrospirota bacterium]|nr:MAG: diacylglycerol kinase family lipid kinase [Nitrospirota bacterium]